ncbi:chorismate mutase 1 [Artemisia annua]|uniref:chorismate mutase n=1 Tax=Artemisia annua TaxID=35608 RepID=A0A2U1KQE0_ARTAN|nr:chorismate mutase 1 [Artemisia annua]
MKVVQLQGLEHMLKAYKTNLQRGAEEQDDMVKKLLKTSSIEFERAQYYPQVLHSININRKIWDMYFKDLLPRLVKKGNFSNCGSIATCETVTPFACRLKHSMRRTSVTIRCIKSKTRSM